jgi:hypothetical protein
MHVCQYWLGVFLAQFLFHIGAVYANVGRYSLGHSSAFDTKDCVK